MIFYYCEILSFKKGNMHDTERKKINVNKLEINSHILA